MLEGSVRFLRQVDVFDFSSISNQGSNKETPTTVVPMLTPTNPLRALWGDSNRGFFLRCGHLCRGTTFDNKNPVDSDEVQRSDVKKLYEDESKAE